MTGNQKLRGKGEMKASTKDFFREIKRTLNRYLSILAIMALGVAFYAGIRSSEPDMRATAKAFYDETDFCDIWTAGSMGITDETLEELRKVSSDFTVEGMYYTEAFLIREKRDFQLQIFSAMKDVSKVHIEEGRLPEKDNEVFLDLGLLRDESDIKIGDTIKIYGDNLEDTLKYDSYVIVGYGTYPQFYSWDRGTISIGNGKADAFIFLSPKAFLTDYYTYAHIAIKGAKDLTPFTEEYKDFVKEYTDKIHGVEDRINELRLTEIKAPLLAELADKKNELADAESKVHDGEEALATAIATLEAQETELKEKEDLYNMGQQMGMPADPQIEAAFLMGHQEIDKAKKELADKQADLEKAQSEIEDAKAKISEGEKEIADLESPEFHVLTRESIQSAVEFGMDAERIGKIGLVFPAIFFLVATFVSLTTMTRMVEEQRIQIGTYKALGYSKLRIAGKYFWYSVSASMTGGILGAVIGSQILPFVIISAYEILYIHLPAPVMKFQWGLSVFSIILAVGCTVIATLAACLKELSAVPAVLMRPEAPKAGRRIILERITFIWKNLSFTGKATARNLFRYKKRLFMTIFGIGGCMALLMVGFGLRDSIADIVTKQYDKIWTYDAEVSITDPVEEVQPGSSNYNPLFDNITHSLYVKNISIKVRSDSADKEIQLLIPEKLESLPDFLSLQDRKSNEKYHLEKDGCIISEKLAKVLKLKVGDRLVFMDGEREAGSAKITAIAENYLYYYVYMSAEQAVSTLGEDVSKDFNKLLFKFRDNLSGDEKDRLASALLELPEVTAITNISSLRDRVSGMMKSLDLVVVVLIVSAGLLAFIVLYNLNNINILERRRELATIRVLGFYDSELAAYVYRENVWLTVFGVALGCFLGFFLHKFVIETCEIDMIMFGRDIKPISYLYSIIITFVFAILVNFSMFFRIRKVDMVESLKSAE